MKRRGNTIEPQPSDFGSDNSQASLVLPVASIARPSSFKVTVLSTAENEISNQQIDASWNYIVLPASGRHHPKLPVSDGQVILLLPGTYESDDIAKLLDELSFVERRHIELIGLGKSPDAVRIEVTADNGLSFLNFANVSRQSFRLKNLTIFGTGDNSLLSTHQANQCELEMELDHVNFDHTDEVLSSHNISASSKATFSDCVLTIEEERGLQWEQGHLSLRNCKFSTTSDESEEHGRIYVIECTRYAYIEIIGCDFSACCNHIIGVSKEMSNSVYQRQRKIISLFSEASKIEQHRQNVEREREKFLSLPTRFSEWKFQNNILSKKCMCCPIWRSVGGVCLKSQQEAEAKAVLILEQVVAAENAERAKFVTSVPSNAPSSMQTAVKRWNLAPPYELANEETWKEYLAFRDKVARGELYVLKGFDEGGGREAPDKKEILPKVKFPDEREKQSKKKQTKRQKKKKKEEDEDEGKDLLAPLPYEKWKRREYEDEIRKRVIAALQNSKLGGKELKWTPATHLHFHPTFRKEVKLLLLVLHRLFRSRMPAELTQMIIGHLAHDYSKSDLGAALLRGLYVWKIKLEWCDEPPRRGTIQTILFSPCGLPRSISLRYNWYLRKRSCYTEESCSGAVTETRFGPKTPNSHLDPYNWFVKYQHQFNCATRWIFTAGHIRRWQRFLLVSEYVSVPKWSEVLALAIGMTLFDEEPLWPVAFSTELESFYALTEKPLRDDYQKILQKCPKKVTRDAQARDSDSDSDEYFS